MTLTLDPDLAARLKAVARERGISFKEAVNTALGRGLGGPTDSARPYRLEPKRLALRQGLDLDRVLLLADELEDAETIRKLKLRK